MKLLLPFTLLFLLACSGNKTTEISIDEQSEKVILEAGNRIAMLAKKTMGGQLKKALGEGGPTHAVQFCNTAAYSMLDTLNTGMDVVIKRVSLRVRNPKDQPTDQERDILTEYQELLSQGKELTATVKAINDEQILFAKPILLDDPVCLNCHGKTGTEIAEETQVLLKELYPNDQATNHSMGDLRGMWSIVMKRGEIKDKLAGND